MKVDMSFPQNVIRAGTDYKKVMSNVTGEGKIIRVTNFQVQITPFLVRR